MNRIVLAGKVISGKKLGGVLGFPTANIVVPPGTKLRRGVYAARIIFEGDTYSGVANFGFRPSVERAAEMPLLEVNIFDFEGDLYGRSIEVELLAFLRREKKFLTLEQLQAAVAKDRENAKTYFNTIPNDNR